MDAETVSPRTADVDEFEVANVGDITRAACALRDFAEQISRLRVASSDDITSQTPMTDGADEVLAATVFGWDLETEAWWKDRRFRLNDSFLQALRSTSKPFWANTEGAWQRGGQRIVPANDFSDYGESTTRMQSSASIAVPVHMPFGQTGVATFHAVDGREDLSEELERYGHDLRSASVTFIESYVEARRNAARPRSHRKLSRHEVSCLRWVALGKTDEEIALITNRTRATIRFHLRNAATKLDAVNRAQSLYKAGQLGYINIAE